MSAPPPTDAGDDGDERPDRLFLLLDGFEGPLDVLLGLARAREVDLARVSLPMLVGQLLAGLQTNVVLERKAEWTAITAWLVLLRSRLLLPARTRERQVAEKKAGELKGRLRELALVQAGAAWLTARPQLGRDIFSNGRPTLAALTETDEWEVDVIEFLWAAMTLFEIKSGAEHQAVSAVPSLLLHSVSVARMRIVDRLRQAEGKLSLADALPDPVIESDYSNSPVRERSRWASTLLAGLELAKQQVIRIEQTTLTELPTFELIDNCIKQEELYNQL